MAQRTDVLAGIEAQAYIDVDSLLRPVYGKTKQGASFGHTKIAGKQVLRRGLSPLAVTVSTEVAAPVVAGIRLRAGKAGSGRAAGSMVKEAIRTARAAGATGKVLVRGDSAYGTSAVVAACLKEKVQFSVVLANADLIDGPLAHLPSSQFAANHAWAICAAMTHNLLRAAATLSDSTLAVARGATLRRRIINVPAQIARPQRRRVLHLPEHRPWAETWLKVWRGVFGHRLGPPVTA